MTKRTYLVAVCNKGNEEEYLFKIIFRMSDLFLINKDYIPCPAVLAINLRKGRESEPF
jgi:hypothetical protein